MELVIALGWDEMESRAAIQPFSSICRDAEPMVWVPYLLSAPSCCVFWGSTGLSVSPHEELSQSWWILVIQPQVACFAAPALPPSFLPTLPSFQEDAHHVVHGQKCCSISFKDILSKHLASLMQIFERCTLTLPRPATTAETHVLCLLLSSDSGCKQGCSHSPASKLVFTS